MANTWPPVLPASFPQPPIMVDEYSGLRVGDKFTIKGERCILRFRGADAERDHLYATELDRQGNAHGLRTVEGSRLRKKVR